MLIASTLQSIISNVRSREHCRLLIHRQNFCLTDSEVNEYLLFVKLAKYELDN